MQYNKEQLDAISNAGLLKFSVICGGAGTGKSTIIKKIAENEENPMLCSPTGKASARLREATGMPASTIHRMLAYDGEDFNVKSLRGSSVIIDEASMLDSWLLCSVIKCRPSKLILVGDEGQLPPVGAGSPFHDIISNYKSCVTKLEKCYRNKEAINRAGNMIRSGEKPSMHDKTKEESWLVTNTGSPVKTQQVVMSWILETKDWDWTRDIIICCRNGDEEGDFQAGTVHGFNRAVLATMKRDTGKRWHVGDRIICKKNFSKKDVWNGTTGTITGITEAGVWVRGDMSFLDQETGEQRDEILWDRELLLHCQHAYALTVHRSQGSQYQRVIFCCFHRDIFMMLSRSLIYTAVTRATKSSVVCGEINSFYNGMMIKKEKLTVLKELQKNRMVI